MDMPHQVIIDIQVRPINTSRSSISSYPESHDSTVVSVPITEEDALKVKTEILKIVKWVLTGKPLS